MDALDDARIVRPYKEDATALADEMNEANLRAKEATLFADQVLARSNATLMSIVYQNELVTEAEKVQSDPPGLMPPMPQKLQDSDLSVIKAAATLASNSLDVVSHEQE